MDSGIPVVVITLVVGCAVLALCLALFCCSKKLPRMLRPDAVSERYCRSRNSLRQNPVAQRPGPDLGAQHLIQANSNSVNIEVLVSNPEQSRNRERRHSRRSSRIPSRHSELPANRTTANGPRSSSSILMEVPTHGIVQSGPNRGMIIPVTTQIREVWLPRLSHAQRVSVVPVQAPANQCQQVTSSGSARDSDAPPTYEEAMRMCPPQIHHI